MGELVDLPGYDHRLDLSRDRHRQQAPEGRNRRAHSEGARQPRLRRLPPEHSRQDARDRLQRPRERLCRRVDAAQLA